MTTTQLAANGVKQLRKRKAHAERIAGDESKRYEVRLRAHGRAKAYQKCLAFMEPVYQQSRRTVA